jgi:hypothetical protein
MEVKIIQSEHSKRLKAFAKKRDTRVQSATPSAVSGDRERVRTECLGKLTAAILVARESDSKLRDSTVIEALRYECREPGAHISAGNRVHRELESIRAQNSFETSIWRSAIKSILELVDGASSMDRNSTQLLDLLDTVAN